MAYRDSKFLTANNGAATVMDRLDPLLVNLHDNVMHYKKNKDEDQAFVGLVDSVVSMLDAELTKVEKILAADVLIDLVKRAERNLRQSLSEQLAIRDDLPETLLHHLAYGDIEIAEPVLKYSPLLTDIDLVYVAHSKGREHWSAIAARENISNKIINVLSAKNDVDTCLNLLENKSIQLDETVLNAMKPLLNEHQDMPKTYIEYNGLPAELAVSVYWHVSIALRASIIKKFKIDKNILDKALESCVQDFTDRIIDSNSRPSPLMIEVAASYAEKNKISERFMVSVLRRRQGRFFMALFTKVTKLSNRVVIDMMRQKGGQSMAVACRALNISKEGFISLFLLSRAVSSAVDPVVGSELTMAIRYYDGLTHKMAKDILISSIAK